MSETYKIFKGEDAELREPTVEAAEEYARFILKAVPRSLTERYEIARQFGIESTEVKDEIYYPGYQKERAKILFPALSNDIEKRHKKLVVPEVDRAEANFSKATGLALNEPSLSLSELGGFLTRLSSAAKTVDINLTDSREPAKEQETAS